jgi:PKHD-type hydroxylase
VLYPSTRLHHVVPVTRGTRSRQSSGCRASIRDAEQRALLLELSQSLSALKATDANGAEITRLAGCYHRLLQMWAEP